MRADVTTRSFPSPRRCRASPALRVGVALPALATAARLTTALLTATLLLATLPACGEVDEPGGAPLAYFQVPRADVEAGFSTLPWPNDIRLDADGTVSLRGFPQPSVLVSKYVKVIDEFTRGWGTGAGIFFRFSAPLDPTTLPASAAHSLAAGASVYLVDIDPTSPTYGQRSPVRTRFEADAGAYIGENHLAVLPVAGWALRPGTTYAAILTRDLRDARGQPFRRDLDLLTVLSARETDDATLEAARQAYAPLRAYLAEQGLPTTHVLNAAVFTTQRFIEEMIALRQAVYNDLPAPPPVPADLEYAGTDAGYHIYEGTYQGPIYQSGDPPYSREGGQLVFDEDGVPVLQRTEAIRFSLSVPDAETPAAGWPVVLYAHGTGGSYRSHLGDEARDLALIYQRGELIGRAAVIGIDQVLHGPRCGQGPCSPEVNFFNFQNPVAARDNVRQGALDNIQLLRLVEGMDVPTAPQTGQPLRFDPNRILFMGHSQGGLTGPPFLAVEPKVKAAVLSGAGGNMILSLLSKTAPVNIPQLVELLLNESAPLDEFHPMLSLIQLFIEAADPVNYGRYLVREPVFGAAPKHVFLSQGLFDSYTPPTLTEALAVAAGLELVGPWLEPTPRLALTPLRGLAPSEVDPEAGPAQLAPLHRPVTGNLRAGEITGVMLQYNAWGQTDGHFVLYYNPEANRDYRHFVGTFLRDGLPAIGPRP